MSNIITSDLSLKNKSNDVNLYRDIFVNSPSISLKPIKNLADSPIHAKLKDFFHINGYNTINEFEGYLWKSILIGLDVLVVSSSEIDTELNHTVRKRKNKVITFFSPVLTLLLKLVERENEAYRERLVNQPETGKMYEYKRKNGPRLLIVCSSCKNAQKIYEFIKSVMMNDTSLLKVILLQGGANDTTYDVKLSNGCDILICATPFCLLRMLGNGKTNFERLEFFVIDEANIVLDKYAKQAKALMDSYTNFLKIQVKKNVAQFILFSSTWSSKLKNFISCFFTDETILFESKLEASYFGNVNHIVHEVDSISEKASKLIELIETNQKSSVLITINDSISANKLYKYLRKKGYYAQIVDDQSNDETLTSISNEWSESASSKQLILICSQLTLTFLNIRNATCVIHFDFPQNKKLFSERLWTMHDNFKLRKNSSNKLMNGSGDSNNDPPQQQWLDLQSHIFFTKNDVEFSEGLLKFLRRIGVDEYGLPKLLIETANKNIMSKKETQNLKPLCPLVKSYGECVSSLINCEYRHSVDTNFDSLRVLSKNSVEKKLYVPNEGHIKFKIAHIKETNHCFVHLLTNQLENEDIDYDLFSKLDLEMQLYYANSQNRNSLSRINKKKLYAFKDVETTIFKRIRILDIIEEENKIAYKTLVECIDYGAHVIIDSKDFIELPKEYAELPPQAVEIYFCDVRPVDKDINWSIASKLFISDKLSKSKEFYGKIQLAAGNILWLHPVSSVKRLNSINLNVIDDCVRRDLVENNYGVMNGDHLIKLRNMFLISNYPVPTMIERQTTEINQINKLQPEYAFLNKDVKFNMVQISAVTTPSKIFIQKLNSVSSLENLNKDMNKFIEENINNESFLQLKTSLIANIIRNKHKPELLSACYCLAKFDTHYCRAQVVKVEEEKIKLFFVDYGDELKVFVDDVYPIQDKFIAKLPFQAILCSMDDLEPPKSLSKSVEDWEYETGDLIWKETHDHENFYKDVLVSVKKDMNLETGKQRSYVVNLYSFLGPIPISFSNIFILSNTSILSETKSAELFPFIKNSKYNTENSETLNAFNNFANLCVNNFVKNGENKRQFDFINFLKMRIINADKLEENDTINSGLIQTLAECIYFIWDPNCLVSIFQFMKTRFFNNHKFVKAFCDHNGLSNILLVMIEFINRDDNVMKISFEILKQLLDIELVQSRVLNDSHLFKALWYLLKLAKNIEIFNRIVDTIDSISNKIPVGYILKSVDYEYIDNIISKMESNFYIDRVLDIFEIFKSRLETNDSLSENVAKILANVPPKTIKALVDAETSEDKRMLGKDRNNNLDYFDDACSSHSSDSSFFETQELFERDFIELLMKPRQKKEELSYLNSEFQDLWTNKDYDYPKLVWDQTNSLLTLKVYLENAKEFNLEYHDVSINFRAELNGRKYGFDFDLFANIEPSECSANTKKEMIVIFLKKKVDGIWSRFLSKLNKPKFLTSSYDNTNDVEEEKTGFKVEINSTEKKHHKNFTEDQLSDASSDEEHKSDDSDTPVNSDFEDDVPHDDKNIYWE